MPEYLKQKYWSLCYYSFLLLFLLGTMVVNMLGWLVVPLLGRQSSKSLLRWASYHLFDVYLILMESSGVLKSNRNILREIDNSSGGLLIIANHPSLLDAPILFSRIRGLICVYKASLGRSLWIGHTARIIGHLGNDGGLDMIRNLSDALKRGEKVLLFPEGTRTVANTVGAFNPGYALAAMRSKVPVQVLKIHSDSPILSKRQSKFKTTRFPCTFLIEKGPVIEPGQFNKVKTFNQAVESWFREGIARKEPGTTRFLPHLEKPLKEAETMACILKVPADPFYCRGHMPGNPVVPAYVQMIWLREILGLTRDMRRVRLSHLRWKFLRPILPNDRISMEITSSGERKKITIMRMDQRVTEGLFTLEEEDAR